MEKIVVVAPTFDIASSSCSPYFTTYVAEAAAAQGWEVVILRGDEAVKARFDAACLDPDVQMISGIGHGDRDVWTGQYYDVLLLRSSYNPDIVKGNYVSHLSCSTGAAGGLLEDTVKKGAKGAQGYKDIYYFYRNTQIKDPLKDPVCDAFIASDVLRHIGLIQGKSLKESTDEAGTRYIRMAGQWDQIDPEVASVLRYDAKIMVIYEEQVPPPPPKYCCLPSWLRKLLGCPY